MAHTITATVLENREKAVQVKTGGTKIWLPKSQITDVKEKAGGRVRWTYGEILILTLTDWIAKEKGFVSQREERNSRVTQRVIASNIRYENFMLENARTPEDQDRICRNIERLQNAANGSPKRATTRQEEYIKNLLAERDVPPYNEDTMNHHAFRLYVVLECAKEGGFITEEEARDAITFLQAHPKKVQPTQVAVVEEGVYVLPGEKPVIVRVKRSRETNHLYAQRLREISGNRLTEADTVVKVDWEFARGLIYKLRPEHKMTMEEAKAFGIRYGICMRCGRKLKDAKSVEASIGPVCAAYFE